MMDVRFRPLPAWPHPVTKNRRSSGVFRAPWSKTLKLLERELDALGARNIIIGAGFRESDLRLDGWPRSDAREPSHPGVELSFDSRFGRLIYATDVHERQWGNDLPGWQANLRAIALGLEALRAVDRYGITRQGEQYAGWKSLPGTALGGLTAADATKILHQWGDPQIDGDLRSLYRSALKRTHPDAGGTTAVFMAVQAAGRVLAVA